MNDKVIKDEQQGHSHAELKAIAAEIAKTNLFWWEEFEFNNPAINYMGWSPLITSEVMRFLPHLKYRLKTKKIKIGNKEIPVPLGGNIMRIKFGVKYYVPNLLSNDFYSSRIMGNDELQDKEYLKRGLIFLDKETAISCAEAMIELLNGGYQETQEKDFTTKIMFVNP